MPLFADFFLAYMPFPRLPYYLTHYVPPQTPLSSPTSVVSALISYLAIIFIFRELMKTREPMKLKTLFQLHNMTLSVGSAVLLVLVLEEILPIWWNNSLFFAVCDESAWTERIEFYYMINYYIKYVELMDTLFLVAKKKPLAFLHVYHHSATALLCYTQLNGKTSMSWAVIVLNLTVHVVMYYYYYATAGGARIWWKKYVTTIQIIQFIIDLLAVYFGTYSHYVSSYIPDKLPVLGNCAGAEGAAIFGCALLTSYLGLFINFYIQTYNKPTKTVGKSVSNGKTTSNGSGIPPTRYHQVI